MTHHTVRAFGQDLENLTGTLLRMGGLCESMVQDAAQALVDHHPDLARAVVERDDEVDAAERECEQNIVRLLALRQPLAHDLRAVIAALKISSDLERIGDLAKNIARRSLVVEDMDPLPGRAGLKRMGAAVAVQLKSILDAYATGDSDAARRVWLADEEIDEHYNSIFREVLTYMMEDPRKISVSAHLLFVAKNLERVGDHCTNIAEVVHFLVTGDSLSNDRPKAYEFDTEDD